MQELYDIIRNQQKQWDTIISKFKKGNGLSDDEIETLNVLRNSDFIDTKTTDWKVMHLLLELERLHPSIKIYENNHEEKYILKERDSDRYFLEYEINDDIIGVIKNTITSMRETRYDLYLIDSDGIGLEYIGFINGKRNTYTLYAVNMETESVSINIKSFNIVNLPEGCHNISRTNLESAILDIYKKYKHV